MKRMSFWIKLSFCWQLYKFRGSGKGKWTISRYLRCCYRIGGLGFFVRAYPILISCQKAPLIVLVKNLKLRNGRLSDIGPTILDILSDGKIKKLGLGTSLLDNVNKNFNNYENLVYIYFDSLKELQSLPELLSIELDDTDQLITNYKKKIQIPFVYSVKNKNYFFPSSDINGNINHSHITNLVSKLKNSNDILFLKCKRIKFFENNEKICALSNHNNNLLKIFELKEDIGIELLNKNLLNFPHAFHALSAAPPTYGRIGYFSI